MLVKLKPNHRFQTVVIAGVEVNKIDWENVPTELADDPRLLVAPAPEVQEIVSTETVEAAPAPVEKKGRHK